jgi:hypothetical protein
VKSAPSTLCLAGVLNDASFAETIGCSRLPVTPENESSTLLAWLRSQ